MNYVKWFLISIISIPLDIINRFLINWIVVIFADKEGNLPKWCYYWQTFDNTLYEGQYCAERELLDKNYLLTWSNFQPNALTWWAEYLNRAMWLLRNSSYGFSYYLFGIKWVKNDWVIKTSIDTPEKTLFIAKSTKGYFNYYYYGKWGMYKFGWKATNMREYNQHYFSNRNGMGGKGRIPHVISINPFKRKK